MLKRNGLTLILVGGALAVAAPSAVANPHYGGWFARLDQPRHSMVRERQERRQRLYAKELRAVERFAESQHGTLRACRHFSRRGAECQVAVPETLEPSALVVDAVATIRAQPTVWKCAPWHGVMMRRIGSWTYVPPPGYALTAPVYAGPGASSSSG